MSQKFEEPPKPGGEGEHAECGRNGTDEDDGRDSALSDGGGFHECVRAKLL